MGSSIRKENDNGGCAADRLLELKAVKDTAERWEELSHPNSYKSFVDDSMSLTGVGIGASECINSNNHNAKRHIACAEDYYKVRCTNWLFISSQFIQFSY